MRLFTIFSLGSLLLLLHVFTDTAASLVHHLPESNGNSLNNGDALVFTQEQLHAQSLLSETNDVIESTQLHLFKRKTELSLGFLDKTIPILEEIKDSMGNLLDNSTSYSYTSFKEADDVLESDLTDVAKKMISIRASADKYTSVYSGMAGKLKDVHEALGDLLFPVAEANNATTTAATDAELNCGGIQRANSGIISYKIGQALNTSEGCLWIVESNTQGHLVFKLKSPGFTTTSNTFLSIGYFKEARYDNASLFHWEKFEPGSDPYDIVVEARVAFVHFVSSPSQSDSATVNQGFKLQFKSRHESGSSQSYRYTNEFIGGPSGGQRYPTSGKYRDNERTAIVLQPTNAGSVLTLKWWDFEGSLDSLSIFSFGSNLEWNLLERLVNNRASSSTKRYPLQGPRNDPVLLIFKSDTSTVFDGFEFEWGNSMTS